MRQTRFRRLFQLGALIGAAMPLFALGQTKVTLRVADYLPANHIVYTSGVKPFMDQAQAQSNGRLVFEYFPGEQLGKAKDLLSLVQSGAVDIALIAPSYTAEKMPLTTIAELPGLYTTSCQGTEALARATLPGGALGDEFKGARVRSLIPFSYQPADLLTAKKLVANASDWKGLKIRSAGGPTEVAITEMSASPVKMGAPDLYQALSRGTVDAAFLVSTSAKVYSLDTVIKGITTGFSMGSVISAYIINQSSWDRLPQDLRDIVGAAGLNAARTLCQALDSQQSRELERMQAMGITITRLDDATRADWAQRTQRVPVEWAARIKASEERVRAIYTALQAKP